MKDTQQLTISVITPSYNQVEFLPKCLESVRDQTLQAMEHYVFDPGSVDGSREVAASYPHVTLVSESDQGQSDAVNKGFLRCNGDIIAWINSDDLYKSRYVFQTIIELFKEPDSPDIIYGNGEYIDENGKFLRNVYINKDPDTLNWRFHHEDGILQPALFMKSSVIENVGLLRNDRHFTMDYEYWIRCVKKGLKFQYVDKIFALARYHSNNKTYGERGKSYAEICEMVKYHFGYVNYIWLRRYAEFLSDGHDGVLASAAKTGIAKPEILDELYAKLLLANNCDHDTYELLLKNAEKRGYKETLNEMNRMGVNRVVPSNETDLDLAYTPGSQSYTVGSRRWAYKDDWKFAEIDRSHSFLKSKILERRRNTCIIVGNGPSLNKTDLSLLEGQDVIISNNAFLSDEIMRHATYYTVVNYLVAEQSAQRINMLEGVHKILPYWLAYCLNPGPDTYFVDAVGYAEFSRDMFKNMSWRHTVTFFNLHLAYGLGYKKVVMIGFDHNYIQPKNVVEEDFIQSEKADENHFNPDYFRGKKWQAADVNMMEEMYKLAKRAFDEDGRTIVNSTVGGKLNLFPRETLKNSLL